MAEWLDELVQEAGAIALRYFRKDFEVITKPDGSPVTTADLEISDFLSKAILERFPGDCIASEEALPTAEERAEAKRVWFIDPIDGTSHFVKGMPEFAILVGLWDEGVMTESAAMLPALKRRLHARKGGGAFVDGQAARVSSQKNMDQARISCWGPEYRSLDTLANPMILPAQAMIDIVAGELDGSVMRIGRWGEHDLAWACTAFEEAGGMLTDGQNRPLRFEAGGPYVPPTLVCSNGALHRSLLGWV